MCLPQPGLLCQLLVAVRSNEGPIHGRPLAPSFSPTEVAWVSTALAVCPLGRQHTQRTTDRSLSGHLALKHGNCTVRVLGQNTVRAGHNCSRSSCMIVKF